MIRKPGKNIQFQGRMNIMESVILKLFDAQDLDHFEESLILMLIEKCVRYPCHLACC